MHKEADGNEKILMFDLYGVIIEESKGNFIPYTYEHIDKQYHEKIDYLIHHEKLFTKTQLGLLSSEEFMIELGFMNPQEHMKDYIKHYLTLDGKFKKFMKQYMEKYRIALLSNDVAEWNQYIMEYFNIKKYFEEIIVSGNVGLRKPDVKIFELAKNRLQVPYEDVLYIDNSPANLKVAQGLGMHTVLFNRDHVEYSDASVNNFDELEKYLG